MDNSLSSIQRLTLQLRLRNQTHHLEIEKQLQDLLRQYLGKILDEELMRANITDRIVLDSLELIIPPLREEAIAVDFTNHLRQKIRDAISEIASVEKRADVKPANENLFDAFSEFLLTGHFPWWYNRFHHGDHNALLRELLTRDAPKVLNIITGSSEKSASFFRFLKQFDVNLVAETFAQQGFAEMPTLIRAFDQYSRLLQTRFSAQQVQQLNFEVFRALFQHAGHSGWIAGTAKQPCIFFLEKATEVLKTDKTKIFLQLQGIPANDPFFAPMTNALSHRFEDIVRELLPETAGATIKSALLTDFRRNIILFLPPDVPQHIVNSIVADALTGLSGFSTSSDTLAEHVLLMIEKHSEKKAINLLLAAMPQFKRDKQKFVALVSKLMNELSAQELINLMHQHASSDFRHIPTQLSHILQAIGADESRNYLIILRKIARDILVEQTHFSPKKTKPQIFRNLVDFISKHIPVALDEIVAKLAEANTFAQLPDSLQKEITPLITPEQKQESLESDDLISSVPFHLRQAAYFMQHLSMSENLQQLSPDDLSAAILELATKFPAKAALLMHTHFSDSFRKSLVLATFPVGFFKQYFAATTPAIAAFAESLQLLFALHPQFSAMLPKLRNAGLIDIIEKLNFKKFRPGGTPQKLDEEFVAMLFREMTRDTVADIKNLIAGIIETQESKQLATLFQRILLAASDHQMYDSETKKDIPEPDTGQKSKQSESMKPEENISSEKSDVQTLPFTFDDLPKQMLADLMEYYFMHKSLPWWSTGLAQQLRKSGSIPLRLSIDDYLIITALKHATGWESEEKVQLISAFSTSAKAIKTIVHQFPESLVQGLMEFLYGVKYKQLIARIEEFVSDGKSRTFLPLIRAYTRFLMIAEYAQLHQFGDAQQLAFLMWQMQGFYPIPEFDDPELYAKHIEQKILEVDPSLTTEEAVKKTREARLATAAEKLPYFDISADETSLLSGRQFDDEDSAALRFLQLESLYPFVSAEKPSPFRLSEKRMFEYLEYYLKTSVLHPQIAFVSKNQFIEMIRQWLISPTQYALGFIAGVQRNKQSASRLVLLFGESVFNLLFSLEKPADIGLPPDAVETDQSLAPAAESHQAKLIRLLAEMVITKGFSELLTEQQENLREYFQFLEGYIKTIRLGLEEPALKLPHNVIASEAKQSQFADIQEIASSFLASTSSAHLLAETMHFEPKKVSFPALLSLIQHDTDFFSESKQWIDGDIHDLIFSKSRGDSGTEDSATVSIDIADDTELQTEITTTEPETDQASIPADDNLFATRSTSVGVQLFSFYLQYGFLPWWS
ncbi:MAG: hypothetical protein KKD31_06275, partial [Bacteroidetes bacterium]|nr:hypothetical protein [Bacteroidota bacterium]